MPCRTRLASLVLGAATAAGLLLAAPVLHAQGPGQPPKRIAPSLDAVLPHLDASVVRVRTPSETKLAGGDATLESARDGVATANVAGLRLRGDLILVALPAASATAASFDVGVFGAWAPAPVVGRDEAHRLVLVRAPAKSPAAPALSSAAPAVPGFLVAARSGGAALDVQTLWADGLDGVPFADGAFVFGVDGKFVGVVAEQAGRRVIVPAETVLGWANALPGAR